MARMLKDNYNGKAPKAFYAYKRVMIEKYKHAIVKLLIPANALINTKFVYSIAPSFSKCRSSMALVVSITGIKNKNTKYTKAYSFHNQAFTYRIGELITPQSTFSPSKMECASGIHWFINRKNAEKFTY